MVSLVSGPIGVLVPQGRIDEAAGAWRERLPIERLGQHWRYDGAQHATGVLGPAEHGFEQRIVWIGNHQQRQNKSPAQQWQALGLGSEANCRASDDMVLSRHFGDLSAAPASRGSVC